MKHTDISQLLPEVFQKGAEPGTPLCALLQIMEDLHEPAEQAINSLDVVLNPRLAPEPFVYYLARWVDLERFFEHARGRAASDEFFVSPGLGRLREMVASAATLSRLRGTRAGLRKLLQIATGMDGFEIEEQVPGPAGRPRPFHIRVRAPAAALPHRAMIERIIQLEKPAFVTTEPVVFEEPEPPPAA